VIATGPSNSPRNRAGTGTHGRADYRAKRRSLQKKQKPGSRAEGSNFIPVVPLPVLYCLPPEPQISGVFSNWYPMRSKEWAALRWEIHAIPPREGLGSEFCTYLRTEGMPFWGKRRQDDSIIFFLVRGEGLSAWPDVSEGPRVSAGKVVLRNGSRRCVPGAFKPLPLKFGVEASRCKCRRG